VTRQLSLLRFAGITIGIIVAISVLWPFIAGFYNHLLVVITNHLSPPGIAYSLKDADATIVISYEQHYLGLKRTLSTLISGYALHFGLILVSALFAATPGITIFKRLQFIAGACLILFMIHIITLLIIARLLSSQGTGTLNLLNNPVQVLLITVGCDLFPLLVWGVISARYWNRKYKRIKLCSYR
jgi:hypothetical protein